jgi:hypothetical protein
VFAQAIKTAVQTTTQTGQELCQHSAIHEPAHAPPQACDAGWWQQAATQASLTVSCRHYRAFRQVYVHRARSRTPSQVYKAPRSG